MAAEPGTGADVITLNGVPRVLEGERTVKALLENLKPGGRVAVEINGCIVPRSRHQYHTLETGDCVVIVQAVGGG